MSGSNSKDMGRLLYLHALSPIHSGTGQAAAVIDLPIAREKATGWPIIPATSLKGVLRSSLSSVYVSPWLDLAFGKAKDEDSMAGALCFGDQRILCLPVRSYFGTFAYVTCPLALNRFSRDSSALGTTTPWKSQETVADEDAVVADPKVLANGGKIYLEDVDLNARTNAQVTTTGGWLSATLGIDGFVDRFAIVADDVFGFLCETATEVSARVKLESETKTVANGQLWYEEAVPAEAIFAGPVLVADHVSPGTDGGLSDALAALASVKTIQIGGKASVGRGLCRVIVQGGAV